MFRQWCLFWVCTAILLEGIFGGTRAHSDDKSRLPTWKIGTTTQSDLPPEVFLTARQKSEALPLELYHTVRSIEWATDNLTHGFYSSFVPKARNGWDTGSGLYLAEDLKKAIPLVSNTDNMRPHQYVTLKITLKNRDELRIADFMKVVSTPQWRPYDHLGRAEGMRQLGQDFHIDVFFLRHESAFQNGPNKTELIVQNESSIDKPESLQEIIQQHEDMVKDPKLTFPQQTEMFCQLINLLNFMGQNTKERFDNYENEIKRRIYQHDLDAIKAYFEIRSFNEPSFIKQSFDSKILVEMVKMGGEVRNHSSNILSRSHTPLDNSDLKTMVDMIDSGTRFYANDSVAKIILKLKEQKRPNVLSVLIERAVREDGFRETLYTILRDSKIRMDREDLGVIETIANHADPKIRILAVQLMSLEPAEIWPEVWPKLKNSLTDPDPTIQHEVVTQIIGNAIHHLIRPRGAVFGELKTFLPSLALSDRRVLYNYLRQWPEYKSLTRIDKVNFILTSLIGSDKIGRCQLLLGF